MKPNDILLRRDGFWCFRDELSSASLRDDTYRAILCDSDEGQTILFARPPKRLLPVR